MATALIIKTDPTAEVIASEDFLTGVLEATGTLTGVETVRQQVR